MQYFYAIEVSMQNFQLFSVPLPHNCRVAVFLCFLPPSCFIRNRKVLWRLVSQYMHQDCCNVMQKKKKKRKQIFLIAIHFDGKQSLRNLINTSCEGCLFYFSTFLPLIIEDALGIGDEVKSRVLKWKDCCYCSF